MEGKGMEKAVSEGIRTLDSLSKEEIITKFRQLEVAFKESQKNEDLFRQAFLQSEDNLKRLRLTRPHVEATEYNNAWSWVNKIVFVLKKLQRPLLSSELIEIMLPHEPTFQHSHHKAQSFSAHLNKAVKYGRVLAYKLGGSRGYYYVLPEWYDEQEKLKGEYENKIYLK